MMIRRAWGLLPPLAVGIAAAVWLASLATPPARMAEDGRGVVARTLVVELAPVRPAVRGYGSVRPARRWRSVAEVAGAIVRRHPDLETGTMIAAGTTVLEIDPTAYRLGIAEARADLAALRAEADQLDVEEGNTDRLLGLERDRLALAERELERIRTLVDRGTVAESRLDAQVRTTLQVRRAVAELDNTLALIPTRRVRIGAEIARTEARLSRAERDLEKTRIVTPFDLRVGTVHVERDQFVGVGQTLVEADGTARAEITAQLPIEAFPRLVGAARGNAAPGPRSIAPALGRIAVEVRLVSESAQRWTGRVLRVENGLDPQARSVPVVVAVEDPYADAAPPERLPLVPNMYVELRLTAPEGPPRISLPESAVHGGDTVYLRDEEGRLARRTVAVAWRQQGRAILADGLSPGDEVILDDLVPAIPGMKITPMERAE